VIAAPLVGLAALAALLVGLVATMGAWFPAERARAEVEAALEAALGVDARLAALRLDVLRGVEVEGLCLGPPPGFTRDWLCVDAIRGAWSLSTSRIAIERLEVERPRIVVETRDGRRNLDVIAARFAKAEPEPPGEPPSIPRDRPLSPIAIDVGFVGLRGLTAELVGEGPTATLGALDVGLDLHLDAERLDAHARVALRGDGPGPNLTLRAPGLTAQLGVRTTLTASVAARADRGLTLEALGLAWRGEVVTTELEAGGRTVPETRLSWRWPLALEPARDRVTLGPLALGLRSAAGPALSLEVDGALEGVRAALAQVVGDAALADLVGLGPADGDGVLTVRGPTLGIALASLQPYVDAFAPGTTLAGDVRVGLVELSGRLDALQRLAPRTLTAALELEGVRARTPAATLARLDGAIRLETPGPNQVHAHGALEASGLATAAARLDGARLGLDARLGGWPEPRVGSATIAVDVALDHVAAGGARVGAASLRATLVGRDPLWAARGDDAGPLALGLALDARAIHVGTGTRASQVDRATVELRARPAQLLVASPSAIPLALTGEVRGVRAGSAQVARIGLTADARVDDLRAGPGAVDARVSVGVDGVDAGAARVASLALKTSLDAQGVALGGAKPERVGLRASLDAPAIELPDEGLSLPLAVALDLVARPRAERATLERFALTSAPALSLAARGEVTRLGAPSPRVRLDVSLAPLALASLPLPAALRARTRLSGGVAGEVHVDGPVLELGPWLERLDAPPVALRAELRTSSVSVALGGDAPVRVDGLSGRIAARVDRAGARLEADLGIANVEQGARGASGVVLGAVAGLDGRRVHASAALGVEAARDGVGPPIDLAGELALEHVLLGPVELPTLSLRSRALGLDAALSGRLERRRFGALRPRLEGRVGVELAPLLAAAGARRPAGATGPLPEARGRAWLGARVDAPDDRLLSVGLELGFQDVTATTPGLSIEDLDGHVPLTQTVLLPEPTPRALGAQRTPLDALRALEAEARALADTLVSASSIVVSGVDVLQRAPRTADYESLRPFYVAGKGGHVDLARVSVGAQTVEGLTADLAYQDGIFRMDRLGLHVFDGDVFGDLALQIAGPGQLRTRLRATMTNVDFDIPARAARGLPPGGGGAAYRGSGNMDLRIDLGDRVMDGFFELSSLGPQALVTMIDALDPQQKDADLQRTRGQLTVWLGAVGRYIVGIELERANVGIRQNLMSLDFDWGTNLLSLWPLFRWNLAPVVTRNVQGVEGYSLSFVLEQPWVRRLNESIFGGRPLVRDVDVERLLVSREAR
jgi:hypothetical protein